jgi:hypothetical protein
VDAENGLSPTMKIFAWRGPSPGNLTETASVLGLRAAVASPEQSAAALPTCIEIAIAGAVVRVQPGTDEGLLLRVLRAVTSRSSSPPPGFPGAPSG